MYDSEKGVEKKSTPEFERILTQLDNALIRQGVIIADIKKRVYTMIEPVKKEACESEKEAIAGGLIGDIQIKISKILSHNMELEDIDKVLQRLVG